jgi:hypothetical protein
LRKPERWDKQRRASALVATNTVSSFSLPQWHDAGILDEYRNESARFEQKEIQKGLKSKELNCFFSYFDFKLKNAQLEKIERFIL